MDDLKDMKRLYLWVIGVILVISAIVWFANRSTNIVDNAFIHYEEFQEIYNTCQKLNTDLSIIQQTPETDKQFDQFSKSQRINSIKQNLNRWSGTEPQVLPSPAEDGSYGTNGDGVFGFTPEEIYIETNCKYIVSTVPLSFTHPVNRLAIISTKEAESALDASKKAMGITK